MAIVSKSSATLRISGEDLDPHLISQIIGVSPTFSYKKGQDIGKSGRPNVAKFGLWSLESSDRAPADVDSQISDIFSKCTGDLAVWSELIGKYDCDLFLGLFMDHDNEGLSLDPNSLKTLGDRGVELGVDIYALSDQFVEAEQVGVSNSDSSGASYD